MLVCPKTRLSCTCCQPAFLPNRILQAAWFLCPRKRTQLLETANSLSAQVAPLLQIANAQLAKLQGALHIFNLNSDQADLANSSLRSVIGQFHNFLQKTAATFQSQVTAALVDPSYSAESSLLSRML